MLPAPVNTENVVAIACLEKQSGVIKPGVCSCIPSTGQSSGTFTSGDGVVVYMNERIETKKYLNGVECTWLISSPNEIRLSFTSFLTSKDLDFVTISSCTSSSCGNKTVLARLSGGPISSGQFTFSNARFTSSTGYLQVLFTSDGSGTQEGFIATWNTSLCTKPLHSAYISSELSWAADNCSWTCDDGYWRSGASCTSCTTSGCLAGEYRGACGTESDAACVVCDESKLPKYSHFISSADACAWACNVGYNIMGHVACKSSVEPSINITTLSSKHLMEWDTTSVISVTLMVSFLPDADVVVRVSVSDQITLTGPSEITFTPLSWNVGQNITVMARNDWLREGNHSGFVTMAVSSVDDRFDGITVHPWTVMIQDNDCKALKTHTQGQLVPDCENEYADLMVFSSTGVFDDCYSCQLQCKLGFFQFMGLSNQPCTPWTQRTCPDEHFQRNGTHARDHECVRCSTCLGQNLTNMCTTYADTQCGSCGTLGPHQRWDSKTSGCLLVCESNYVMNMPTQECEFCPPHLRCAPGFSWGLPRANCTHCLPCPPKPLNAYWLQQDDRFDCMWECELGFVLELGLCVQQTLTTKPLSEIIKPLMITTCNAGYTLENFECKDCFETTQSVNLPEKSKLNQTWHWIAGCRWQCKILEGFSALRAENGGHWECELTTRRRLILEGADDSWISAASEITPQRRSWQAETTHRAQPASQYTLLTWALFVCAALPLFLLKCILCLHCLRSCKKRH